MNSTITRDDKINVLQKKSISTSYFLKELKRFDMVKSKLINENERLKKQIEMKNLIIESLKEVLIKNDMLNDISFL